MNLISAEQIQAMTPDEAEATLIATTSVLPLLVAKASEARAATSSEWLSIKEAAEAARMSAFYFYDHWKELSFCAKRGRCIRVNRGGMQQWLSTRNA
jgi:hypothetical protein